MKSSQLITALIVAVVFAALGYFLSGLFEIDSQPVAISLFIGALLSPILCQLLSANTTQGIGEIQTLYVGNLPYRANEAAVRTLFF